MNFIAFILVSLTMLRFSIFYCNSVIITQDCPLTEFDFDYFLQIFDQNLLRLIEVTVCSFYSILDSFHVFPVDAASPVSGSFLISAGFV